MAPPQFLAGSAQLRLYWSLNGELAVNTFGLLVATPPTFDQALANRIGVAIKGQFTAILATHMAPSTNLVAVGVRDWRTASQPEFRDTGAGVPGIGTGDPLPNGAALCITLRTALAGKRFTGRVYLGGYTEAVNDTGGRVTALAASASANFVNQVGVATSADGLNLAVLSRPSERTVITKVTTHADGTTTSEVISDQAARPGAITQVSTATSRNDRWEYQRRRDNGRGSGAVSTLQGVVSVPIGAPAP